MSPRGVVLFVVEYIITICIYDSCLFIGVKTPEGGAVVFMDMPMYKIPWMTAFQDLYKCLKSPMGQRIHVVKSFRRGMGQQNIDTAMTEQGESESAETSHHFFFGKLVFAEIVVHGTPKPHNPDTLMNIDTIIDAYTPFRRPFIITGVVVAVNIEQGKVCHCDQEGQVFCTQIPRRENKVHAFQPFLVVIIPQGGGFYITKIFMAGGPLL